MIAIDTTILVRLLTRDDEKQYQQSYRSIKENPIYIPDTVILETEWVLRLAYELKPNEICQAFKMTFGLANVTLANAQLIAKAKVIHWHENGMDFADAMHLAYCQTQTEMKTFDSRFIKNAKGLCSCTVSKP